MDKREAEAKFADSVPDELLDQPDIKAVGGGGIAVRYVPSEEAERAMLDAMDNPDTETLNHYLCEVCGTEADLTEAEAYQAGWDYPPFIGIWGIVSPRTCPNCLIDRTAYWAIITGQELTEAHRATVMRIMGERIVVDE